MSDLRKVFVYTPGRIFLASALGGLPAGLYLYRHNANLLGKSQEGKQVFLLGAITTGLGMALGMFGSAPWANSVSRAMAPVSVVVPFILARQLQSDGIQSLMNQGLPKGSYAKAAGVGILSLAIVLGCVVLMSLLTK